MKRQCELCSTPFTAIKGITCQSIRCVDKGAAYCKECTHKEGEGFRASFKCLTCNEREQKQKKRLQRAMKNPKRKISSEHNELQKLRKHFNVSQLVMATYFGISHRQYQIWERDFSGMQPSSRMQIYMLCVSHAPEFAKDWYEQGFELLFMAPVSGFGMMILAQMEEGEQYSEDDIIEMAEEWTTVYRRAFRNLISRNFIIKTVDGVFTRNLILTKKWYDENKKNGGA